MQSSAVRRPIGVQSRVHYRGFRRIEQGSTRGPAVHSLTGLSLIWIPYCTSSTLVREQSTRALRYEEASSPCISEPRIYYVRRYSNMNKYNTSFSYAHNEFMNNGRGKKENGVTGISQAVREKARADWSTRRNVSSASSVVFTSQCARESARRRKAKLCRMGVRATVTELCKCNGLRAFRFFFEISG